MLCVQAQGKAKEEEREDGEITDSEKQVKAEEKRQKAREDMEAAPARAQGVPAATSPNCCWGLMVWEG